MCRIIQSYWGCKMDVTPSVADIPEPCLTSRAWRLLWMPASSSMAGVKYMTVLMPASCCRTCRPTPAAAAHPSLTAQTAEHYVPDPEAPWIAGPVRVMRINEV